MDVPLIEQVKIQAKVLVPLVRTLQAELGEEQANAIVRRRSETCTASTARSGGKLREPATSGTGLGSAFEMYASGDAMHYEVVKQAPDAFELNVTECRYAKFYKEIGAPELGFLLTCSADFPMAEGFGAEVQLTRTQTIMQGASHCDFRYALKQGKKATR